jgi:hypothetical protein
VDLSLLIPALIAGAVAILATLAIERLGGRLGGVLGAVPTTLVPAAIGVWQNGDPDRFRAAMAMVPVGMLINGMFLWTWRVLPPRLPPWPLPARLGAMTAASLTVWFAAAASLTTLARQVVAAGADPAWVGGGALVAGVAFGLYATTHAIPAPAGTRRVPRWVLASRGLLAAVAIAVAILVARHGQPLTAGVAAVFPAIFLTSMVSLWFSQGVAVPAGAVGPLILGSASPCTFALLAIQLFPRLGPWWGCLVCWITVVTLISAPIAWWLTRPTAAR